MTGATPGAAPAPNPDGTVRATRRRPRAFDEDRRAVDLADLGGAGGGAIDDTSNSANGSVTTRSQTATRSTLQGLQTGEGEVVAAAPTSRLFRRAGLTQPEQLRDAAPAAATVRGMTPRPLSSYDYRWATTPIDAHHVETIDEQPALPALAEPEVQPAVLSPVEEPLVAVTHRKIRCLSVYWHAGWPHATPTAWLRASVATALYTAVEQLDDPFGVAVFDAWRPLELQHAIYDAAYSDPTLPAGFVSVPSTDPTLPPPHLTGGTVDVTLTYAGVPLGLGTTFDTFDRAAHTAAFEAAPSAERTGRRYLYRAMRAAGFVVLDQEWWHFEHGTRRWAAITGQEPTWGPAAP